MSVVRLLPEWSKARWVSIAGVATAGAILGTAAIATAGGVNTDAAAAPSTSVTSSPTATPVPSSDPSVGVLPLAPGEAPDPAAGGAGAPAPAVAPVPLAVEQIATTVPSQPRVLGLVQKYFPAEEVGNAMAVARAESGQRNLVGDPNSDGSRDFGIFQLNDGGTLQSGLKAVGVKYASKRDAQDKALDPKTNVMAAAAIFKDRGGWGPWVAAYKLRIVAKLYSNKHGDTYGKFSAVGDPQIPLAPGKLPAKPAKPAKPVPAPAPAPTVPSPVPTFPVTPTPTPTPTPTFTIVPDPEPTVIETPTGDPTE